MVAECFVVNCRTNFDIKARLNGQAVTLPKPVFFKVPKNPELRRKWEENCKRPDRCMKDGDMLCSRHFRPENIITEWTTQLPNGDVLTLERKVPILKADAVPVLFSEKKILSNITKNKTGPILVSNLPQSTTRECEKKKSSPKVLECVDVSDEFYKDPSLILPNVIPSRASRGIIQEEPKDNSVESNEACLVELVKCEVNYNSDETWEDDYMHVPVWDFLTKAKNVALPSQQWSYYLFPVDGTIIFMFIDFWRNSMKKMVKFTNSFEPKVYVNACDRERITLISPPTCSEDISDYLKKVDKLVICEGTGDADDPYSSRCMGILMFDARRGRCECCRNERRKKLRMEQHQAKNAQKQQEKNLEYNMLTKHVKDLEDEIRTLKQNIKVLAEECALHTSDSEDDYYDKKAVIKRVKIENKTMELSRPEPEKNISEMDVHTSVTEMVENFEYQEPGSEEHMTRQIILTDGDTGETRIIFARGDEEIIVGEEGQQGIVLTKEDLVQSEIIVSGEEMEVQEGENIIVIVDSEQMLLDSDCLVVDENCEFVVQDAMIPEVELTT